MRNFMIRVFPVYGQNPRRKNMRRRKPAFRHTLRSEYLNVKHKFFTSCLEIKMTKSVKYKKEMGYVQSMC